MGYFSIISLTEYDSRYIIFVVNIMSFDFKNKTEYDFLQLETVDSTNEYAKKCAISGAKEATVIIAEQQTKGKGSKNRSFFSDADGIYMSIVLRPEISPTESLFITTCAAVAVSRAIDKICGKKTGIKWVNDIFLDDKKICGILCESALKPNEDRLEYAVLGIGINFSGSADELPDDIKDIAGFIFEKGANGKIKENLILEILDNFFMFYKNLKKREFLDEYRSRSILIGKRVVCIGNGGDFNATVIDIDDNAHLIVKTDDGNIKNLYAGEVSLRLEKDN